jgi:hypothetical protein
MKRRFRLVLLVIVPVGCLIGLSRLLDFPAIQDPRADGSDLFLHSSSARFYSYPLGGFIDQESLWRIDGDRTTIESGLFRLGLARTDTIPDEFWRLCPYYWPKGSFSGAEAYRSAVFEAGERGQDGVHYFAVHDPAKGRAYVWVKDNF